MTFCQLKSSNDLKKADAYAVDTTAIEVSVITVQFLCSVHLPCWLPEETMTNAPCLNIEEFSLSLDDSAEGLLSIITWH